MKINIMYTNHARMREITDDDKSVPLGMEGWKLGVGYDRAFHGLHTGKTHKKWNDDGIMMFRKLCEMLGQGHINDTDVMIIGIHLNDDGVFLWVRE